jgi:hypothetical protein
MVTFEIGDGSAITTFNNDDQSVLLKDGRRVRADELQTGDIFLIRRDDYVEITGEVVVS